MTCSRRCFQASLRPLAVLSLACAPAHAAPSATTIFLVSAAPPSAAAPALSENEQAFAAWAQSAPDRPPLPGTGVNANSERLELFGDLFSPTEISVLSAASVVARATRAGLRANDPDATSASAYAGAISTALVFDAGPEADAWPALTSWSANGSPLGRRLEHQVLPLTLDFTQRHPFYNSASLYSDTVFWLERSIVILPTPHGSRSTTLAADSLRFGTLEFLAGDRRRPMAGRGGDFSDFLSLWLKRAANVTLAELLNAGLTHSPARYSNRVAMDHPAPQYPVSLSYAY